jgi:hypothetical protein
MNKIICSLLIIAVSFSSCDLLLGRRVRGNGKIVTEQRAVNSAHNIKLAGSYDVELTQGPVTSVSIETDENLLPYIVTAEEDGSLVIRSKDHENLDPTRHIKVYITTDQLQAINLVGSGNINGKTKFAGEDNLFMKIAGSGNITIEVNTPKVKSEITGSGNINISGETKDEEINIAGHGDYKAEDLKSENAEVHIAGSGDVNVFAENKLVIHIAGSGNVFYKGNAKVEQHVAGSGTIKQMQ